MAVQSEDLYLRCNHSIQMVFEGMWLNEGTSWDYRRESFPGLFFAWYYLEIEKNRTLANTFLSSQ